MLGACFRILVSSAKKINAGFSMLALFFATNFATISCIYLSAILSSFSITSTIAQLILSFASISNASFCSTRRVSILEYLPQR